MSARAPLRTSCVDVLKVEELVHKVLVPSLSGRWRVRDPVFSVGGARVPVFSVAGVPVRVEEVGEVLNKNWAWRRFSWTTTVESSNGAVTVYLYLSPRRSVPAYISLPLLVLLVWALLNAVLYLRRA